MMSHFHFAIPTNAPAQTTTANQSTPDQALDLHDRMIGALFNRGKGRHAEEFQQSGEAMHEKVRLYERIGEALRQARQSGIDPFPAIEAIIPWKRLSKASQGPNGSRKGVRKAATN